MTSWFSYSLRVEHVSVLTESGTCFCLLASVRGGQRSFFSGLFSGLRKIESKADCQRYSVVRVNQNLLRVLLSAVCCLNRMVSTEISQHKLQRAPCLFKSRFSLQNPCIVCRSWFLETLPYSCECECRILANVVKIFNLQCRENSFSVVLLRM